MGKHPAVAEANVYGVSVPGHDGRAGCAAIVFEQGVGEVNDKLLQELAQHVKKELPAFAVPVWIRVTREMQLTGTNKQQKVELQKEGIDPQVMGEKGDVLYWLRDGTYRRFTMEDLKSIEGGNVKL